jgi:hypothetical protein
MAVPLALLDARKLDATILIFLHHPGFQPGALADGDDRSDDTGLSPDAIRMDALSVAGLPFAAAAYGSLKQAQGR